MTTTAMPTATQTFYNSAVETMTRYHDWAKTIEKGHFGHYYTIVSDTIDYYVVDKVAKPFFEIASDQIRRHPYAYGVGTVLLLLFLAHPTKKSAAPKDPTDTTGTAPATPKKPQHKRTHSDPSTPSKNAPGTPSTKV